MTGDADDPPVSGKRHKSPGRRDSDKNLAELLAEFRMFRDDQKLIADDIHAMREVLDIWKNAKGFLTTMRAFGAFVSWLARVGIAIGTVWAAIWAAVKGVGYLRGP